MRRASLTAVLFVLLVSLFLLSVLSNILTGYPERPPLPDNGGEKPEKKDKENKEPSILLFKVSPTTPQLFWRVSTADHYSGSYWHRTTEDTVVEDFPHGSETNATKVFTVELDTSRREVFLPLPSSASTLTNLSASPADSMELYMDSVGDVYTIIKSGGAEEIQLVYEVSWRDVDVDDALILPGTASDEILEKYLQLPEISSSVWELAEDLEDASYSILDQVLADVQYLRTTFIYDVNARTGGFERFPQSSSVSSYLEKRKGVCLDAATMLAIILRIQKIPARVAIGYKPERTVAGKLLYYTTGAHAVTEVYLPPYGWVQFDATPPCEEDPLVEVLPFKKEASPGSTVFCQLSITNRRNYTDHFKVVAQGQQDWTIEAVPEELLIQAFQTSYSLLRVTVPHDADIGEKDVVTITVASLDHQGVTFSILAVIQVENLLCIPTITSIVDIDETAIRKDSFEVSGAVLMGDDEQVDNMTVFVFLTRSTEVEGTIVGKGCTKQGNFDIECMAPYFVEIGDYELILISTGTAQHAPSSCVSSISVHATTEITLGSEQEFLLGFGAIHGHLLWDNGTGFSNAPISLEMTSLNASSGIWNFQNLTCKDGSFRIHPTVQPPGWYKLEAVFSGDEYVLGSNATQIIELKHGLPVIQISGENVAIRGEVFSFTATIRAEETRVWGEPVAISFDNQLLTTIETADDGSILGAFMVDSDETLGPHLLGVSLEQGNVSAIHKIAVKSKTRLTTRVSDVAGGMFFLFSASLTDDHGQPIHGAEIAVDNYSLSWRTDRNGNLTFLLDVVSFWAENLLVTARFEGSEAYLPTTTEEEIVLKVGITLPFLIPSVVLPLVALGFVYVKHHLGKSQPIRQTSVIEIQEQRGTAEKEPIHEPQETQALTIALSSIGAQFPNVWGVNDRLHIEIALDRSYLEKTQGGEVEVFIDEETVGTVGLSPAGCAKLSCVFVEKGEHKIRAILPSTDAHKSEDSEIKLRIVDYGEEVINIYNQFLENSTSFGIPVQNEMTTREIESLLLATGGFNAKALGKATICFEKAEYSNHLVTRKDYEIMYLSSKELNDDVEQKE